MRLSYQIVLKKKIKKKKRQNDCSNGRPRRSHSYPSPVQRGGHCITEGMAMWPTPLVKEVAARPPLPYQKWLHSQPHLFKGVAAQPSPIKNDGQHPT